MITIDEECLRGGGKATVRGDRWLYCKHQGHCLRTIVFVLFTAAIVLSGCEYPLNTHGVLMEEGDRTTSHETPRTDAHAGRPHLSTEPGASNGSSVSERKLPSDTPSAAPSLDDMTEPKRLPITAGRGEETMESAEKTNASGLIIVSDPLSYTVLVDHHHALPEGFTPPDLVEADIRFDKPPGDERRLLREKAARAIEKLFEAAQKDGIELVGISGYRSYDLQASIFAYQVQKKGEKEAERVSARPGTSEHQTGLAIDVADQSGQCILEPCFGKMPAGRWLKEHAHRYGFIIRYPEDGEAVTGYMYEPWHLRYVGEEVATAIYEHHATLEAYLETNAHEVQGP